MCADLLTPEWRERRALLSCRSSRAEPWRAGYRAALDDIAPLVEALWVIYSTDPFWQDPAESQQPEIARIRAELARLGLAGEEEL